MQSICSQVQKGDRKYEILIKNDRDYDEIVTEGRITE